MISYMSVKRVLKRSAGWAAVGLEPFVPRSTNPRACVLVYHRVANIDFVDPQHDDWNVSSRQFEKQIRALADFAEIVPLERLPDRLRDETPCTKPIVCVTLDDGYATCYTEVLPVLQRYGVHATMFVVTDAIGRNGPLAFDGWSRKNFRNVPPEVCRSMNWQEVDECVSSGLVSIGSHSHTHRKGTESSSSDFREEAERSRSVLVQRLGASHASMYAYPYGASRLGFVPDEYTSAVKMAGFRMAVSTDLGMATSESDLFMLPRVEAHTLDQPWVLRAKSHGALAPYHALDRLRSARRAK